MSRNGCDNCARSQGGRYCRYANLETCRMFIPKLNPYAKDKHLGSKETKKGMGSYFDWGVKKPINSDKDKK